MTDDDLVLDDQTVSKRPKWSAFVPVVEAAGFAFGAAATVALALASHFIAAGLVALVWILVALARDSKSASTTAPDGDDT